MTTRLSFPRTVLKARKTVRRSPWPMTASTIPKPFLPAGAAPGAVLTLSLDLDPGATAKLKKETKSVQDDLATRDPGGDIKL